jgi:hypothetical protein
MKPSEVVMALGGVPPKMPNGTWPDDGPGLKVAMVEWPDLLEGTMWAHGSLSFENGRLQDIVLYADKRNEPRGGESRDAMATRIYGELRRAIAKRLGDPTECAKEGTSCTWRRRGEIEAMVLTGKGYSGDVLVGYRMGDPGPDVASAKLMSTSTPSSIWSKSGWSSLRWGMGMGDVVAKLKANSGLRGSLVCEVMEDAPGAHSCFVREKDHSVTLFGQKPSLMLQFKDARLYSVMLTFHDSGSVQTTISLFRELGDGLKKKYGNPDDLRMPEVPEGGASVGSMSWRSPDLNIFMMAGVMVARSTLSVTYESPEVAKAMRAASGKDSGDQL